MRIQAHRWQMTAPQAPLERVDFDVEPGAGEVVVEIAGCGVCHTDLGYYYDGVRTNQPLPLTLGHEISGRIVAAGAGAEDWMGVAVIVPAGACHNVKNTGEEPLQFYTLYGPPEHKDQVVHKTKEQAEADHDNDEWDGKTSE